MSNESTVTGEESREEPEAPVEAEPNSAADTEQVPQFAVAIDLDRNVNFALQQNDVRVVKSIVISNHSDRPLRDVELRIESDPGFAFPFKRTISILPEHDQVTLRDVDIQLSPSFLLNLHERVKGLLKVELWSGTECLLQHFEHLDLLAYNEWSGLQSLPEILAAFVMPNHPEIGNLLGNASDLLARHTGSGSMSGYQSGEATRVVEMAKAIYEALQGIGFNYANPPASFEERGQRVRTPDQIVGDKLATCLDSVVLFAACLEQAGLFPLIVMLKEHAICGVWLKEDNFSHTVIFDVASLRNRIPLREVLVFETVCLTTKNRLPFEHAVNEGNRRLQNDDDFICVLDIRRARNAKVRPLPLRGSKEYNLLSAPEATTPQSGGVLKGALPAIAPKPEDEEGTPAARLDHWRRKLLDLTMRNNLLNFGRSKKTLPVLTHSIHAFEDALADGVQFRLEGQPKEFGESDPRDADAYHERTGGDAIAHYLEDELRAKRIHIDLPPDELSRRLFTCHSEARLAIEEGGASGLYVAIGFLKWYEAPSSERPRLAPILLIPVELERKTLMNGFRLTRGADDARVNTTLLEMLKQDHGLVIYGLDPLPQDDSGVNVDFVLNTFRKALLDIPRWDIQERVEVGFFSFAKFIMWRDLQDRAADLLKNPVVAHLINTPNERMDPHATFPEIPTLDEEFAPSDCFCPVDSDSSQLRAVLAAANGRSFVLEGPPGTGKSQTITNIIAHCLAAGKSVLFVSEKMAALNVVHDRLSRIGLGRFCLELHSNKARKHDVIKQLGEALNGVTGRSPDDWAREAAQVSQMRQLLNGYVDALHRRRSNGESIFQATSRLIGLRDVPVVKFSWPNPQQHDRDGMEELRDTVDALVSIGASCGDLSIHPWASVEHADWSMAWRDKVADRLAELTPVLETLPSVVATCARHLGLPESGWSFKQLGTLSQSAALMTRPPGLTNALMLADDWDLVRERIKGWIEKGKRRDALRAELSTRYTKGLLEADLAKIHSQWKSAETANPLIGWYKRWAFSRELKPLSIGGKLQAFASLGAHIEQAQELKRLEDELHAASDAATSLFGKYWQNGEPEWEKLIQIGSWTRLFREYTAALAGGDLGRVRALRQHWASLVTEGRELLRPDGDIGRAFVTIAEAFPRFTTAQNALTSELQANAVLAWGDGDSVAFLPNALARLQLWKANLNRLQEWCNWREKRAVALRLGLGTLVEGFERGDFGHPQLVDVFHRGYYTWWLAAVTDNEDVLRKFVSVNHERDIKKFRHADLRYMELTKQFIAAKLAEQIPQPASDSNAKSEVGFLQRELGKKVRHRAIRQLIGEIPNLLPRLKPCMLMSPMSIAQYLDPKHPPFDVVIFDEASQITPWDAIGAIARGKQAIIVGDPKQLPPTNFFQRTDEIGPTDEAVVEDLESILNECMTSLHFLTLDWHYRSRHESLIHFSNVHYYDNRLLTFPSPHPEGMGVQWRYVADGVYDKGKSRTNRVEAERVVEEITQRLSDPQRRQWTIGVVTFNAAQQLLIEELLEEARRKHSAIDSYFSDDANERLFVKNLENVQGDERDVIIFSICYGPDAQGRLFMNFGPINNDGGERRLNVAITRARRELVVYSSLRSDQIDLTRTRATGSLHLKTFLDYAERGPKAIAEVNAIRSEADFDSPFEQQVFDALTNKGWRVDFQVGCSGYRIDLAVVNPDMPGRYLLGIECDGANYHRAKTARDRDRLREQVLRGLGWDIARVWSSDWWNDPRRETARLNTLIEEALQRWRTQANSSTEEPVPMPEPEPELEPEVPSEGIELPAYTQFAREDPAPYGTAKAASLPEYIPATLPEKRGTQDDFYKALAAKVIREDLEQLVRAEAPVSFSTACKRILAQWDLQRATPRAQDRVREVLPKCNAMLCDSGGLPFLWVTESDAAAYTQFRTAGAAPESQRKADEIAVEEFANGALHILRSHISLSEDDLVKEAARLFGFQRTGPAVDQRVRAGVQWLIQSGRADSEGGTVILPRKAL